MAVYKFSYYYYYAPAHRVGALSASYVCLSRIWDLSREQRGLGRLKLAQR